MENPMGCEIKVDGVRCGKNAVKGRCFKHRGMVEVEVEASVPRAIEVGDTVTVQHIGIDKVGTVVEIRRTCVMIDVPIHGGADRKIIRRSHDEITR
jgi:invasion protein IalB